MNVAKGAAIMIAIIMRPTRLDCQMPSHLQSSKKVTNSDQQNKGRRYYMQYCLLIMNISICSGGFSTGMLYCDESGIRNVETKISLAFN